MNNNTPKVLFLANSGNGLYNFRGELIGELINPGSYIDGRKAVPLEVYISLPKGDRVSELKQMGCHFIETDFDRRGMNPVADLKLYRRYKNILREIKPDVVLTYTIKPNIYGGMACGIQGIPYIENITGLGTAIENAGFIQKIVLKMYKRGLKKASCVFFQNKSNLESFTKGNIVGERVRLLQGSGVNTEKHYFEPYPIVDYGEDKFLFIGRIMKDKGIEELLDASIKVKEEFPRIKFDIVGRCDENYTQQLNELESKGVIKYWGQQPEVHPFIKECSALILPSYHEGMANVLLEASSTGRPVLASNIPGCVETFSEGVTGFGFEPKNAEDLYKTIKKFIMLKNSQKIDMGKAAREKMINEFDRSKVVNAYLDEIKKLEIT